MSKNFLIENTTLIKYTGNDKHMIIPESVTVMETNYLGF